MKERGWTCAECGAGLPGHLTFHERFTSAQHHMQKKHPGKTLEMARKKWLRDPRSKDARLAKARTRAEKTIKVTFQEHCHETHEYEKKTEGEQWWPGKRTKTEPFRFCPKCRYTYPELVIQEDGKKGAQPCQEYQWDPEEDPTTWRPSIWWWKKARERKEEDKIAELYNMGEEEVKARNDYLEEHKVLRSNIRSQATAERWKKLYHPSHTLETSFTRSSYPNQAYNGCPFLCCIRCRLRREDVSRKTSPAQEKAKQPCEPYTWGRNQPEEQWRPKQSYWAKAKALGSEDYIAERFHMTKAEVRERNRRLRQQDDTKGGKKTAKKRPREAEE